MSSVTHGRQSKAFRGNRAVLGLAVICVLTVVALFATPSGILCFSPLDGVRRKAEPEKIVADVARRPQRDGRTECRAGAGKRSSRMCAPAATRRAKQSAAQEPEKIVADARAGRNETGEQSAAQEPEKIVADARAGRNETGEQSVAQEPERSPRMCAQATTRRTNRVSRRSRKRSPRPVQCFPLFRSLSP